MMIPKPARPTSIAVAFILLSAAAWSDDRRNDDSFYSVHPLVSDGSLPADHVDPSLKNSWGIAFNPNGAVWVSDNQTNKATLYDGTGTKVSLGPFPEVDLPAATNGAAAPTGTDERSVARRKLRTPPSGLFGGSRQPG
jgi:hypothetical protein